jgi:hypothetical protein
VPGAVQRDTVHQDPTCPRCGNELRPPGLWSNAWECPRHGVVHPYLVLTHIGPDAIEHVVGRATVPLWMPHPLPPGWVCSGMAYAGDERTGASATATCLSGPGPLGGAAELVIIAEEPGVGLGARHAGLVEPDPGAGFDVGPPDAKVFAASHPTALWSVPVDDDRAIFVGEAMGLWLWAIVWPATAGVLMYDDLSLIDLRESDGDLVIDFGALSPRLSAMPDEA